VDDDAGRIDYAGQTWPLQQAATMRSVTAARSGDDPPRISARTRSSSRRIRSVSKGSAMVMPCASTAAQRSATGGISRNGFSLLRSLTLPSTGVVCVIEPPEQEMQNGSGLRHSRSRSGREDLNLRPQRPERCALTGLRYSPSNRLRITQSHEGIKGGGPLLFLCYDHRQKTRSRTPV
jgi:hypothetical protein